jgi:hypothetical protein
MKTAMESDGVPAKQNAGNRTNHPPRPKQHPWNSGRAYRGARERYIETRAGRPPGERQ